MIAVSATPKIDTDDLTALHDLKEEWVKCCLNADWQGLGALLTDHVVFLPPDQPMVEGKEAVLAWLRAFPPMTGFSTIVEEADGRADFAWARGAFTMTVEPVPGQRVTMKGKWSATYLKQDDGRWLCASDTWNVDGPTGKPE
jgi:ketosteroid isomerase-like protein